MYLVRNKPKSSYRITMLDIYFRAGIIVIANLLSTASIGGLCAQDRQFSVTSPGNAIKVSVDVRDSIYYSVAFNNNNIIETSAVALITNKVAAGVKPRIIKTSTRTSNEVIDAPVPYRRSKINDHYNELTLSFKGGYSLTWRAYDDGVAYRWNLNIRDSVRIMQEVASFNFSRNDSIYFPQTRCPYSQEVPNADCFHSSFEEPYRKLPVGDIKNSQQAYLPVLVDGGADYKLLLTESDLLSYPGMFVRGNESRKPSLKGIFASFPLKEIQHGFYTQDLVVERANYIAATTGKRSFPWRVLAIVKDEKSLPLCDIVYRLAEKNRAGDVSWIKPGKSTSEWLIDNNIYGVDFKSGFNTDTYKYYIDFAEKFNLEYVLFDAGWSPVTDLLKTTPGMDMEFLTDYARKKGVGLVLWTSSHALSRQMTKALDRLAAWGIKGIMVDFMERDDQKMVDFYEEVGRQTAARKIFVDFHGSFKPTGMERTYPNLLTREGAMVQEYHKWSSDKVTPGHDVLLAFIRNVAGPLDYEPGNMLNETKENHRPVSNKPASQGTRIHQLAMFVIYESPYAKLGGNPSDYMREPDFTTFMIQIPTIWTESRVLEAKLGEYIVMLRTAQDGTSYIAAMNDWTPRDIDLKFDYLEGEEFTIDVYQDGVNADRYASDYRYQQITIKRGETVRMHLAPGGGWVGKIRKR